MLTGCCAALLAVAAGGCGARDDTSDAQAAVVDQAEVIPEGGDSALVVEDEQWAVALPEDESWLDRVWERFQRGERREAAAELRSRAARLQGQEGRAPASVREELSRADQGLEQLAARLEAGQPVEESEMRRAIVNEHLALVAEHRAIAAERRTERARAKNAEERMRVDQALGAALTSAAGHLERAADRAGRKDDPAVRAVVQEAKSLRERMNQGDEAAAAGVQATFDRIGAAADELRRGL
jgi:hypothetical protein